jgi:hypothetical protein
MLACSGLTSKKTTDSLCEFYLLLVFKDKHVHGNLPVKSVEIIDAIITFEIQDAVQQFCLKWFWSAVKLSRFWKYGTHFLHAIDIPQHEMCRLDKIIQGRWLGWLIEIHWTEEQPFAVKTVLPTIDVNGGWNTSCIGYNVWNPTTFSVQFSCHLISFHLRQLLNVIFDTDARLPMLQFIGNHAA